MKSFMNPTRLIGALLFATCFVHGAQIPVTNTSFEDPAAPASPGYQTVNPTGWTRTGNAGVQLYSAMLPFTGGANSQVAWVSSGASLNYASDLLTIAAGETYTLNVSAGSRSNYASSSCTVALTDSSGTVLATTGVVNLPDDDVMRDQDVTFTATAGHAAIGSGLRIRLSNGSGSLQTVFENVRLNVSSVNADPSLAITSIAKTGNTATLQIRGGNGKSYVLEKSLTLTDGFPITLGAVTLNGANGTIADSAAIEPMAFYRMHLAPAASLSNLDLSFMSSGWGTPQANKSITASPL
jgi:hypothetical protein